VTAASRAGLNIEMRVLERFDEFLTTTDKRVNVLYGGAGSGKSYSVAQLLAFHLVTQRDLIILVVRKTGPALSITCWPMLRGILNAWGVPYNENKVERTVEYNGNIVYFRGLDDPEKIKSFEANLIWAEEATELTPADFNQLDLRLRRNHPVLPNRMYLTFNPIDAYHWCVVDLVENDKKPADERRDDVAVMHSNYRDNPYLPASTIKNLKSLEKRDLNFYRIYTLGEPGVLENLIYSHWEVTETMPSREPDSYGLDFGFNDPTVLVAQWREDGVYHVKELLYASGMTNVDLIKWFEDSDLDPSVPIYADPSRPDQIEDLIRAGFNVHPAKTKVKDGIDYVKGHQLRIHEYASNLLKEIRGYKYREMKDGRVLDEPVDFMDHAMDAMRYAIYSDRMSIGGKALTDEDIFGGQEGTPSFFENNYG